MFSPAADVVPKYIGNERVSLPGITETIFAPGAEPEDGAAKKSKQLNTSLKFQSEQALQRASCK